MAADSVRRGSTTTKRPPRARSASMRFSNPGAPMIEPADATGLPPMQTNSCVRSTSGTGIRNWWPNIAQDATMCGNWSTLVAE